MGRRFSKLKALAALDSLLFFRFPAFATALTAEKRTTDCPPAGKVHVKVASDPPCCLASRYSANRDQSNALNQDCCTPNGHPLAFDLFFDYLAAPGRDPAWRLLLVACGRDGHLREPRCAIAVDARRVVVHSFDRKEGHPVSEKSRWIKKEEKTKKPLDAGCAGCIEGDV